MQRESDFPGLVRVYRNDGSIELNWVASPDAIAVGFIPDIVRLHYSDWSAELAERCQNLEAQMAAWLADWEKAEKPTVFDGTIAGLIEIYLKHPDSPFLEKWKKTQQTHHYHLQKLSHTVGGRRLCQLSDIDFRRWYQSFKEPRHQGGPDQVSGAHHIKETLRIVLSFGAELGLPHAERLRDALSAVRFPNTRAGSRRRSRLHDARGSSRRQANSVAPRGPDCS
jgi:hypothetical protein